MNNLVKKYIVPSLIGASVIGGFGGCANSQEYGLNPRGVIVKNSFYNENYNKKRLDKFTEICETPKIIKEYTKPSEMIKTKDKNGKIHLKIPSKNPSLDHCIEDLSRFYDSKISIVEELLKENVNGYLPNFPVTSATGEARYKIAKNIANDIPGEVLMGYLSDIENKYGNIKLSRRAIDAIYKDVRAFAFDVAVISLLGGHSTSSLNPVGKTIGHGSSSGKIGNMIRY